MSDKSTISVFVIDDSKAMVLLIRRMLEQGGYPVAGYAYDGGEALAAIQNLKPAIIISDLYLPDMNGIELVLKIRSLEPTVKIILCSATSDLKELEEAKKANIDALVPKPIVKEDLIQAIETIIKSLKS